MDLMRHARAFEVDKTIDRNYIRYVIDFRIAHDIYHNSDIHFKCISHAQQGYENPREATGRIVCANCHLANKPVDIEQAS